MIHQCAVIGNPIAHSKSPEIHASFAAQYELNVNYEKILATASNFQKIVHDFFAQGGRGLNITVPFKETAFKIANVATPYAKKAKAANTLWMKDGKLYADNTDGRGLINALIKHDAVLNNRNVLIIGAGGAARGIILPLLEAKVNRIDIMNRTPEKAKAIIEDNPSSQTKLNAYALSDAIDQSYDIIINATSTGLSGETLLLSPKLINNAQSTLCYDMVYGKRTPFIDWATQHKVMHIYDGYSMLIEQAKLSFLIWFEQEISKEDDY